MKLPEFLLARITEDEVVAAHEDGGLMVGAHFSVARMLAECEAKRRIVKMLEGALVGGDNRERQDQRAAGRGAATILNFLALPYADHPDYDEAWRA